MSFTMLRSPSINIWPPRATHASKKSGNKELEEILMGSIAHNLAHHGKYLMWTEVDVACVRRFLQIACHDYFSSKIRIGVLQQIALILMVGLMSHIPPFSFFLVSYLQGGSNLLVLQKIMTTFQNSLECISPKLGAPTRPK